MPARRPTSRRGSGTRLRRRLERGLSQDRLAYRAGVSLKTIQRVEKLPAASCRARTLRQFAAALSDDPDIPIRELTRGFTASQEAEEPRQHQARLPAGGRRHRRPDHGWPVSRQAAQRT